jgi:mRNA interferase RelE/StbE
MASLRIRRHALHRLERATWDAREPIVEAIDRLADQPHAGELLKGEFDGLRRIRVGRFRIVYEVFEDKLTVLRALLRQ